jgi:hypothetical protein
MMHRAPPSAAAAAAAAAADYELQLHIASVSSISSSTSMIAANVATHSAPLVFSHQLVGMCTFEPTLDCHGHDS